MNGKKYNKTFAIEPGSAVPLYEQIKREIKLKIVSGILLAEDQLPTIREYARNLKVNVNTIVKVYFQLDKEGYIYSKPGQGYFVKRTGKSDTLKEKELFRSLTEEYLKNVTDLGFSIETVIKNLKVRQKSIK